MAAGSPGRAKMWKYLLECVVRPKIPAYSGPFASRQKSRPASHKSFSGKWKQPKHWSLSENRQPQKMLSTLGAPEHRLKTIVNARRVATRKEKVCEDILFLPLLASLWWWMILPGEIKVARGHLPQSYSGALATEITKRINNTWSVTLSEVHLGERLNKCN